MFIQIRIYDENRSFFFFNVAEIIGFNIHKPHSN